MSAEQTILKHSKALILVGEPDFGRCPLASRVHRAFWPLGGKPVLLRLVEHLIGQGIRRVEICSSERNRSELESLQFGTEADVRVRFEMLPRGTAGNIHDVLVSEPPDTVLFVFNGAMMAPPCLSELLEEHQKKGGQLTFFFQPTDTADLLEDAEVYLCQPDIVRLIPSEGYFDLKENLVPVLVKEGYFIACANLKKTTGTYRTWREYRDSLREYFVSLENGDICLPEFSKHPSVPLWTGENVQIAPKVSVTGPVLIGKDSVVKEGSFLFGPLMIESDVWIGPHSTVSSCILGSHATVGAESYIDSCVIGKGAVIAPHAEASDKLIVSSSGKMADLKERVRRRLVRREQLQQEATLSSLLARPWGGIWTVLLSGLVLSVLVSVYWNPTLIDLWRVWMRSDEYSSGILVPFLAVYIIWDRRKTLFDSLIRPFPPALFVLLSVQMLRLGALLIGSGTLERLSFFLTIGSLLWMILGWPFFKKIYSIWLYLYLMFPLPKFVEWKITIPLQKWATLSAVFCLETLGFNVIREGNIININGTLVAVAEACNGLRMLTAFFVVSGFIVLICKRPLWQKVLIFVSSVPIALLCNTVRLALTAIAFLYLEGQDWEKVFHDYGGLAMMPLAVALIVLELWFLSKLFIHPTETVPLIVHRRKKKEL